MKQEINSPKYNDILEKAHDLFWKHGLRKVSIEEICKEAGVSKMTFYRYFKNKTEIAKVVISNIIDEGVEKYRELMSRDISFEEKVKLQLLAKFEATEQISQELVNDIYTDEKLGIKQFWMEKSAAFTKEVISDYTKAQKKGWIRKDIKLDFIMYFNGKVAEMVSDPNLVAMYDNMQDLIMEIANLFFYGIFPPKTKSDE